MQLNFWKGFRQVGSLELAETFFPGWIKPYRNAEIACTKAEHKPLRASGDFVSRNGQTIRQRDGNDYSFATSMLPPRGHGPCLRKAVNSRMTLQIVSL
jgi:hypothetical protein